MLTSPREEQEALAQRQTIEAETIRELLQKGILNTQDVSRAILKLRIRPAVAAAAFGYDTVTEFLQEFVTPSKNHNDPLESPPGFEPWSYDDMIEATKQRFIGEKSFNQIAEDMGRTVKSVQSFFRRTFSQGLTIDRPIWDLVTEGSSTDDICTVADLPRWRVEFVRNAHDLDEYCHILGLDRPVLRFV
jgi:hypothetical protein